MTLPTTINVGPYTYSVHDSQEAYNTVIAKWGQCIGYVDHDSLVIVVAPTLAEAQKRDTLLHEVKHAVWNLSGLHPNRKLTEEEIVSRSTTLELDTLRRNPEMVAYLMGADS